MTVRKVVWLTGAIATVVLGTVLAWFALDGSAATFLVSLALGYVGGIVLSAVLMDDY